MCPHVHTLTAERLTTKQEQILAPVKSQQNLIQCLQEFKAAHSANCYLVFGKANH